jgi:dTMP kinase
MPNKITKDGTTITSPRGKYIVFEGIDGGGKSTLTRALVSTLKDLKIPAVVLPFPSHQGAVGKLIRDIFAGRANVNVYAIQHLMVADQIDHEEQIEELLDKGVNVILDRHAAISAFVYGAEDHTVEELFDVVQPSRFMKPDLTFVVDVPPDVALMRRKGRGEANPFFENDDVERLVRLRQRYMAHVLTHDEALAIDGTKSTIAQVEEIVARLFS